ncbi:MAG: potassium transporter [Candidatus Thioglobus sp.]|jgi:trk system potassium uptake protein TrkH|uniref:TrkH family potassium uptake protein n=1 Tax=Candidatus Thioglobus sp. TaxID=2026721 RepID=UPI0001BD367E|nr:TrkH family potassium uptake protein [Candidatus Thioglobus sp.]EEZ80430.1 MAG: Trk-type K+ transport system, membrane component [uncultured Candidatus Thioglobus sp.]MBT3186245.1 potassium transporter [Candidatus Thioglobus sp.]MBT6327394.1 potassium transporter [Candidatus Thioglobus sp.]MBT6655982.1 potassium transporter [Candidatus Thioglobus sp.]MBT7498690.1 potassium transporter [Candidatus Thioglobus sp.]
MQFSIVFKTIGLLLMVFSLTHLPPVIVDLIYAENQYSSFLSAFALTLLSGLVLWLPFRKSKKDFRIREGVLVVVSFWFVLSLFATIPFLLSESLRMSFSDAFFESMSGLTTTGSTVLSGLDDLPKAILYYRQQLQWLGGMGIIVLAVAILPMLGVGGMELYHAESSGISKERLTPKLTQTAKALWKIYISFTIICAIGYYLAGMNVFDAIGHSYSTVAIGGFSTHDASIGFFNSSAVESVAIVFMLLAGINFSLHFFVWQKKNAFTYMQDSEFKTYLFILSVTTALVSFYLFNTEYYYTAGESFRHAIFQTVSIATTTGFASQNYSQWPFVLPVLLIFVSFIGACAGSTGGGIKVVRVLLMFKLAMKEIKKLIHPSAQINIKLNQRSVSEQVLVSVWGFFSLYVIAFIFILIALMFTGLDQVSAFSATAASMNNLGPGLGEVAANYGGVSDTAKWILSFSMLLGRLEILTLMALLHKAFWRF